MRKALRPGPRRLGAALAVGLLWPAAASALELSWTAKASLLAIAEDNGLASDPFPLLPAPGAELALGILPFLAWEPSLDLYATNYGYLDALGRAAPAALENRWVAVTGFVIGSPAVFRIELPKSLRLRLSVGPAVDFRLCLPAWGMTAADQAEAARQTGAVVVYFWESGRWFYPTAGVGLEGPTPNGWRIGGEFRVWFPLYRAWTDESAPALDNWRFAVGLRVTPPAKPAAVIPATPADAATPVDAATPADAATPEAAAPAASASP
jgi:hypothetical protein